MTEFLCAVGVVPTRVYPKSGRISALAGRQGRLRACTEDFQPEEAWLDMGQGRYSLRLCWSRGSNTISVCINRMAEVPASQFADLQEPASYDLRLYPIPRGDSIPDL